MSACLPGAHWLLFTQGSAAFPRRCSVTAFSDSVEFRSSGKGSHCCSITERPGEVIPPAWGTQRQEWLALSWAAHSWARSCLHHKPCCVISPTGQAVPAGCCPCESEALSPEGFF